MAAQSKINGLRNLVVIVYRKYSSANQRCVKGLVLGAYNEPDSSEYRLTETATRFNEQVCLKVTELLKGSGLRKGKALVFDNVGEEYNQVAVAGLGEEGPGYNPSEAMEVAKENVRVAAGEGAKLLQDRGVEMVMVEDFSNAEAAAEGGVLAIWRYQELRAEERRKRIPKLALYTSSAQNIREEWMRGVLKGEAQNLARRLTEVPANLMTPAIFAQSAVEILCGLGVSVDVKERGWIESMKMKALLSMGKSSCQPPYFLEISYCGADTTVKPIVLVGKGVTFDTGGINLKEAEGMTELRGDMAGAAVVVSVLKAVAQMQMPINIQGLIPLCENLIGGVGIKPGDVILGMNGKTIRIENTDNEGRVMLADALSYSAHFKPCLVMDIANITSGLRKALGEPCSGVYSTSDDVWKELRKAGGETGDRFWRLPLWQYFSHKVTDYVGVDVNNVGKGCGGDPCLGAAFLLEFVPPVDFVHVDISGVGVSGSNYPYLAKGSMTGRPTRTLIQFLYQLACIQASAALPQTDTPSSTDL